MLIPIFGYRAAIWSTIASYWSQLSIPFLVGYYRRSVSQWLGRRWLILIIFVVIALNLVVANTLMHVAIWQKILITIVALTLLSLFYGRLHLKELV
jgi:hypothetical protein